MVTAGQVLPWMLLAAAAGGLGAAARFLMDGEIRLRWRGALPLSTLVINVAGSLLLGLTCGLVGTLPTPSLVALVSETTTPTAAILSDPWTLGVALATVGFCGGFTTFSTAMFEVTQLLLNRRTWMAVGYWVGSAVAAVIAVVLGMMLGAQF